QTVRVSEDQFGITAEGSYQLRLSVRDKRGRRAARAAGIATWLGLRFSNHRFPVVGSFTFGGAGSRFNSDRPGHKHQGQDVSAAEGTPLVAPHAGVISWVSFQAEGAGWYVVLDSAGEDRDYVFMHLKTNSLLVKKGDTVVTGQQLAQVGTTGVSTGPHLHFEIWTGGHWWAGGHPVDPLPILQQWFSANPGGATQQLQSLSEQPQPLLDAPATP
ncbi:MAG: M23 family metallopeptidase, partial [Thermoleophilaceae bacterium]|nr:M23 family metallopeptidase [Thermoleophilaceae bacterium]